MGEYVHSKQVRFDRSFASCGILEAHHLPDQSARQTVFAVLTALYHKANPRPSAWVLFSDVIKDDGTKSRGQLVAEQISKLFGEESLYSALTPRVNPRTGNTIQWWMWELDHEKLRKWYQDELANRVTEE